MKKIIAALAIAAIASTAYGQQFISVDDGVVTLNGDFSKLAGINAKSTGGYLSRGPGEVGGVSVPGQGSAPWAFGEPSFLANTPNEVAYGILGADAAIDVSGKTATAVLYSESQAVAAAGDLTVELGVNGEATPAAFPVVPEPATGLMAAFGLAGLLGLRRRR